VIKKIIKDMTPAYKISCVLLFLVGAIVLISYATNNTTVGGLFTILKWVLAVWLLFLLGLQIFVEAVWPNIKNRG
jgi:hypothetical protein